MIALTIPRENRTVHLSPTLLNLKLAIFGRALVFTNNRGLKYYAFSCKAHGLQVDYPQGYSERLACELCNEKKRRV